MTATDKLRRLLDERGVEWGDIDTGGKRSLITLWHGAGGMEWQFYENTKTNWTLLKSRRDYLTPEQAVEATLGWGNVGRYVGLRQGKYWERMENSDYYCGGCGWKVTDHDSYCPECGGALHEATLGAGTCHKVRVHKEIEDEMHCSECGRFLGFAGDIGAPPCNYCLSCGRKVVDE